MNAYKKFSYFYDEVMQELNYSLWHEFTEPYLQPKAKILDLACGSGTLCQMFALDGYEVSGLDLSETIIEIAREKAKLNRLNINYYIADMQNFQLNETFDVITCYFDSINFLASKTSVNATLRQVHQHLKSQGYFIFDIFSKEFMHEYQNNTLETDYENFKINWQTKLKNNTLTHKIKITEDDKTYTENYYEYYYELKDFDLEGFELVKVVGDFNDDLELGDERILIVLRKI